MTIASILAALVLLGAPLETRGAIAEAIARHARTPSEVAFLAAWSEAESHFSADIIAGRCKRWQCDAHRLPDGTVEHRARGLFQIHRRAAGSDWDALPGNIDAQVRSAARMARWALKRCDGNSRCAFRVLGGLAPDRRLRGEDNRVASFNKARAALQ